MGGIWIYELLVKHASLERTGQHNAFAIQLLVMPLIYPLALAGAGATNSHNDLARHALFGGGLHHRTDARLSERVNIVLAMFLCHWALIGLSKVYFFGIPEDYLLACSTIPALYIFFREYVRSNADRPMKPRPMCSMRCSLRRAWSSASLLFSRYCTSLTYSLESSDLYAHAQNQIFYRCYGT